MTNIHSYSKIYAIGHPNIDDLLKEPVVVQEKIDGSQFSFKLQETESGSEVLFRSRGQQLITDAPQKMFERGVEAILLLKSQLKPEWTYRGEYVVKPKHNALTYERTPQHFFILYDIETEPYRFLSAKEVQEEARLLGLDVVPTYFEGDLNSIGELREILAAQNSPILGGKMTEGIVIKNYSRFTRDDKVMMGKLVRDDFKEIHETEWKKANPQKKDIILEIGECLKNDARREKAIQHLREAGQLTGTPKDIGPLMKELSRDINEEAEEFVKDALYKAFRQKILRIALSGFPDYYKKKLEEAQEERIKEHSNEDS